ncbi:MAG: hypothetical protein KAX38_03210 [Candidatus Krumholzibacteria bacterium]|nr:hypothetical protein [Candidatus Krumholzibacteria bacterium]
MMKQKYLVPVVLFVIALLAILTAFTSIKLAVAVFTGLLIILFTFLQPFFGLIVYLILLLIRPQEFILVLSKLRIMLSMGILILLSFVIHKIVRRERITILPSRQHTFVLILLL